MTHTRGCKQCGCHGQTNVKLLVYFVSGAKFPVDGELNANNHTRLPPLELDNVLTTWQNCMLDEKVAQHLGSPENYRLFTEFTGKLPYI